MSAYLTFFDLEQSPFEGKAQSQVVLGTRALRDAFGTIRSGLEEGAARICVSGGAGLGKTSLARALPKLLGDDARVANVIDPGMAWEDCRGGLAKQWGLASGGLARGALIEARSERPLVLVIDQAERASEEFLDHLDVLLSYRTEADEAVVQSILLANLGTRDGEQPVALVCWLDRIQTLQLEFEPLTRDGVASYVTKHLRRAGWRGEALFTEEAGFAVHGYTGGVPREISALCEQLLIEAASREQSCIDANFVHAICEPVPMPMPMPMPEVEAAPSLAAALEFFESAATADPEEANDGPDSATPVDHPEFVYDAQDEEGDRGGAWANGEDEASETIELPEPALDPEPVGDDPAAMDAAIVPETAPSPYELTPDPAYDSPFGDDSMPPPGTGWLRALGKLASVALATTIGGLAFLSLGGDDTLEADTLAEQAETPTRPETIPNTPTELPAFAAPSEGFVDPTALDALPSEVLEQVHDITARVAPATIEPDLRSAAPAAEVSKPIDIATTPAPEPAYNARAVDPAPAVQAVETASESRPEIRLARDVVEDSPGPSSTEYPIAGSEAEETAPAGPAAPGDAIEEERFW